MNLQSVKLGRAFSIIMKTLPLLGVRLGAYLAFWGITLVYLAIAGGLSALVGLIWAPLGFILFIVSLVALGPIYQLAKQYIFYLLKAAYLAVAAEFIAHGKLPDGAGGQLAWGRKAVEERFGEVSAMFVVDELVESVIRTFTRSVYRVANFLPGETFRNMAKVINRVITFSMTYIDEAIMARSFWRKDENVWVNAADGVVLYAQVWKPILMNAVVLMLMSYVPFIVVVLLFSAPIAAVMVAIGFAGSAGYAVVATLVLAWLVKVALGDAFAMVAMIDAYRRETADMKPNPDMVNTLEGVSDKFVELKNRAMQAVQKNGAAPAIAVPASPPTVDSPASEPEPAAYAPSITVETSDDVDAANDDLPATDQPAS